MRKIVFTVILAVSTFVMGLASAETVQDLSFQRVSNVVLVSQNGRVVEMISDVPGDLPLNVAYQLKHGKKGVSWTGEKVEMDLLLGLPLKKSTEITETTYSYLDGHFTSKSKDPQRLEQSEWFITAIFLFSVATFLFFSLFCETAKSVLFCGAANCAVYGYVLSNLSFWGYRAMISGLTLLLEVQGLLTVVRLLAFLYFKYRKQPDPPQEAVSEMIIP